MKITEDARVELRTILDGLKHKEEEWAFFVSRLPAGKDLIRDNETGKGKWIETSSAGIKVFLVPLDMYDIDKLNKETNCRGFVVDGITIIEDLDPPLLELDYRDQGWLVNGEKSR